MTKKKDGFEPVDPDRPEDVIVESESAAVAVADAPPEPSRTDGTYVVREPGESDEAFAGRCKAAKKFRILVWQEGETTPNLEYLHDAPRDREVTIGGVPYDHCNTTADCVWVYRRDRKN